MQKLTLTHLIGLISVIWLYTGCKNEIPQQIFFSQPPIKGKDPGRFGPLILRQDGDSFYYFVEKGENSIKPLSIEDSKNLMNLTDSVVIHFSLPAYKAKLSLVPTDGDKKSDYLRVLDTPYTIIANPQRKTLTIRFSPYANKLLKNLEGSEAKFIFNFSYAATPDIDENGIWTALVSNSFMVQNPSEEGVVIKSIIFSGIALIALNLAFFLLAIWFPWFRRNIFGENLVSVLGLFSINGLITKPILLMVPLFKMALLKDYRQELLEKPDLAQWRENRKIYNQPQIGDIFSEDIINALWGQIDSLHRNKQKCLWVIEGRSGLGKTALLEQLTLKILKSSKTPVLIRLNGFTDPGSFLQREFEFYGQLIVDSSTALSMVQQGGFHVLLDGLNEAIDTERVRHFVKSILRNNTVIISSQFDPIWTDMIQNNIDLKPFGKQQLQFLLNDEDMVEKVLNRPYLFDVIQNFNQEGQEVSTDLRLLPFTATLIKEYIHRHRSVPPSRLRIYEDLIKELKTEAQYSNFEAKTWDMFCNNSQNIVADEEIYHIDTQFLKRAVKLQVLTEYVIRGEVQYRFRHERIFRFVVALYIYRIFSIPDFFSLQDKFTKDQDKLYWSDVIEFIGEIHLYEAQRTRAIANYKAFLLKVGIFEPLILKKRLINQWHTLSESIPMPFDATFNKQLMTLIAQEGREI